MLGKALDAFLDSPLSGIVPWALMAILAGPGRYEIAVWGALGFSLLVLALDRRRNIPVRVLEMLGVSFFVVLALSGWWPPKGRKSGWRCGQGRSRMRPWLSSRWSAC
ncbi:hypothetical protein [Mycolicibacterium fortuitum]|uniref:hypothetical protein n=1 Tax=Mycolicibacterium fortuitum TaxID=1766 RepID=UPI001CE09117|nr:hypothetical protein [Mycolicibacterium fortuitum]MCA4751258.1 hypothetical protein [Mycolicibacterium fortuitum]MDG5773085.1 hypothetical protein [Mycolicibacterium fortuitum]MDG5783531.1 hypothetical protein [Mycolicibacterium fortuitum]MDG5785635.1 hypothetical protein [Mycolicibacterium fortuitum]